MITPNKHDYITFTRRIMPAVKIRSRDAFGGNHDYDAEAECVADWTGRGQVRSVQKNPKKTGGVEYRTCRVDTGSTFGVITVILDETCELVGEQITLVDTNVNEKVTSMYDTRGDGA